MGWTPSACASMTHSCPKGSRRCLSHSGKHAQQLSHLAPSEPLYQCSYDTAVLQGRVVPVPP